MVSNFFIVQASNFLFPTTLLTRNQSKQEKTVIIQKHVETGGKEHNGQIITGIDGLIKEREREAQLP